MNRIANATQNPPETSSQASDFNGNGGGEPATNKQVKFLLSLGKRLDLSTPQVEARIEGILGRKVGVYDLSKRDAGWGSAWRS